MKLIFQPITGGVKLKQYKITFSHEIFGHVTNIFYLIEEKPRSIKIQYANQDDGKIVKVKKSDIISMTEI